MALIGNDFVRVTLDKPKRCSECDAHIAKGETALISYRHGKTQKVVCGEDCRLAFDDRFWQAAVAKRKGKR